MGDDRPTEDDLKDKLTTINGIGDAKASQIIDLVDTNDSNVNVDELREHLENAQDYLDDGQPGYADKYVRRALERLDGGG